MASPRDLVERALSPSEVRVTVPATPEEVWAVLSDPETYPEWLAGAQRIQHVDTDFPEPGARFDHEVGPSSDATVADDTEALVDDPPHRLQLEVHAGPVTGMVEFRLQAVAGGTQVRFLVSPTGGLGWALPVLRAAIHVRNRGSLARLTGRCEPVVVSL
jgi:uncharacterized protein YndB with AHSA1/START domain